MRIIAGAAKGRVLKAPPGFLTRPTADRVREALFSVLMPYLAQAKVLDAFAGSGALGLEALSRGAATALFMERDAAALRALRYNIETCRLPGATIKAGDTLRMLPALNQSFDIIFLDPPYNRGLLPAALSAIRQGGLLEPEGITVAESSAKKSELEALSGWEIRKYSVYGDTALYYLK